MGKNVENGMSKQPKQKSKITKSKIEEESKKKSRIELCIGSFMPKESNNISPADQQFTRGVAFADICVHSPLKSYPALKQGAVAGGGRRSPAPDGGWRLPAVVASS
ncbi:unnamed protein product [Cuscuta epithymum]|uniref:Uncharacterized protein n=1 Tax=Cuscuta epithymum TaxID=186058 RepID=A0AAV0GCM5_9ASTE|nr:unnamed protein product [Cuscuta epithymum]